MFSYNLGQKSQFWLTFHALQLEVCGSMITTVSDFILQRQLNKFHISKSLNPMGAGEPTIVGGDPLGVKPF